MGLLNIIRKLRLRLGLPIREIARRTGLSRSTVKKYLKEGTIEPVFARPCARHAGLRTSQLADAFAKRHVKPLVLSTVSVAEHLK